MKLKSYTNKDRYGNMTSFEFYEDSNVPMMEGIPDHPGNPKGTDTVPAWLTPGEFVMNAEATRMFEPQIEQMNNAGRAMQAQQGGTIPQYEADGGPVYMETGGLLDKLLGMFTSSLNEPVDTSNVVSANSPLRNLTNSQLVNTVQNQINPKGPTRPTPTMSNKMYMDFLKNKEGFRNEAYLDSAGVPTIGYGFTEGVQMGDTMDEKTANERLLKEMAKTDQDYNKLVTADLNPNQQAAVKSLLYNIGGPQFANSKARAALNAGDFESFKKEAAEFRMADGKVIPGLENRRRDELELFDTPFRTAKEVFDERIPNLQGKANERTSAEEFSGTGTAPRTAKEVFDERIPALRDKVDERNLTIPDELTGSEMGRRRTAQEVFDSRVPALQSRVNDRTAAEEFSGTGTAPRTAQEIFNERIPALRDKVDERNLSIPDELSGPEMGRSRTRKEIFDSRIPALQNMANPEANEMLQASEFEGLGGVPPMGDVPIDFSQYSDGPFGPKVPDAIGPRSEDQQIRDEVLLSEPPVPEIKEPPKVSTSFDKDNLLPGFVLNEKTGKVERAPSNLAPATPILKDNLQAKLTQLESAKQRRQSIIDNGGGPGDPIFDQEQAYIEKLEKGIPGTKEKVDALTDKTTKVFTDGELEVTDAEIEKKTIQAEKLVDLGLSDAAKKVEQEVKDLKDKKGRLETQSKELTVPPTNAPPKSDPSPFAKGGEDTPITDLTKTVTPEEVVKNTDGSSVPKNTTPESATKAGEGAPPEQINKAESFLSGIFGDLFDKGELKRMAIMYVGGRMLGGSHSGSLNFAAKQYVKRVDSKASEHKKYVKELTKDGSYTPKSIALYNKTKNIADLEKKGASYAPTGGAPITKMVPQFNKEGQVTGYKKATLVPVKNSITGGTHYQSRSGAVMHPAQVSSLNDYREELDANTEAYKQRRSRILGDMEGYFSEIRDKPGNFKGEGNDKEYIVGVGPKEAALAYYDWAKKQGVDPDSTAGRKVMSQAYSTMVAEAAGKDIKYTPNDFTRYLEDQQLRETTGAPELFIINEDAVINKKATPKYVQADKMSLLYQNLDTVISSIPNSSTDRGDIIGIAIQKWNKLDSSEEGRTLRKKYNDSAEKSAGESGFYKYMMDTAQALHAELNKPKE